jgi:predicted Zn finger-like uncharacterized protein
MKMKCPHCGVSGSVSDSLLGKNVKCPKCKKIFRVTEKTDYPAPKNELKKGSVIEASGHVADTSGPAPGMTAQDEAALEQEIAKIFDDMKNSALEEELSSMTETGSSDSVGSAMNWDMDTKDMRKDLSDLEQQSLNENDLEAELQEMLGGKCSVCGTFVGQKTKHEIGGNIYCSVCLPESGDAGGESSAGKDLTVTAGPDLKNALTGFWQTKGIKFVGVAIIAAIIVALVYQLFFNHK